MSDPKVKCDVCKKPFRLCHCPKNKEDIEMVQYHRVMATQWMDQSARLLTQAREALTKAKLLEIEIEKKAKAEKARLERRELEQTRLERRVDKLESKNES